MYRNSKMRRSIIARGQKMYLVLLLIVVAAACTPKTVVVTPAPAIALEQKAAWILRLEDQRMLRDPAPPPPPAPPVTDRRRTALPTPPPPPPSPDLVTLLSDPDARIRRRAALAIGRVGLADGVAPLTAALADAEPEVRQMAAFGLGLVGDRAAVAGLTAALKDPDPIVHGRAADALGLIGDASAAAAIGEMVTAHVRAGVLSGIGADELGHPLAPAVEAVRLGVYALVRLKAYDPLASAVLAPNGAPVSRWWPIAYALQRIEERRAVPALIALAQGEGLYTRAFAARGLGVLKEPAGVDVLIAQASRAGETHAAVSAVRALGQIGDARATAPLLKLLQQGELHPNIRLETVIALGALRAESATPALHDLLTSPWPSLRAAALRAVSETDPENFVLLLSGLDPDPHWSVRAALADALAALPSASAVERVRAMLQDEDQRVIPAVLKALVALKAPDVERVLIDRLKSGDVVVRSSSATLLGDLKAEAARPALLQAYEAGKGDSTYLARAAALGALAKLGGSPDVIKAGLSDPDWAVRVRTAALLDEQGSAGDHGQSVRPAPTRVADYAAPHLIEPKVSPQVYIETARGTIQIELNVIDAPLTSDNFIALARKGFFNGLAIHRIVPNFVVQGGDPRSDGEGGPGYTIRDELNEVPYLRGTVGMALDWEDTGGSQFFITHSPQPHLDARYTVFGRVVNGMDVVDRLQQWDVIERVRIWDGQTMTPGGT
jgi:cyclophilin family peptidyl-prolyl cis-trans isomerase/HEAT repeat protein